MFVGSLVLEFVFRAPRDFTTDRDQRVPSLVGFDDVTQNRSRRIRRNYPILSHFRFSSSTSARDPAIFIESDTEPRRFRVPARSLVYQRQEPESTRVLRHPARRLRARLRVDQSSGSPAAPRHRTFV